MLNVALHGAQNALPVLAQPADKGQHNTIRAAIVPFACWRVEDVRFDFDSSIVRPDVADELAQLAKLIEENKRDGQRPLASVFGHADPTGKDDYNKKLSGRRAMAVYGLLARDVDLWEKLFTKAEGGDSWEQKKATDTMLVALGFGTGTAEKKRFQKEHGLQDDGIIGPKSRRELFHAYMDKLAPITLAKDEFLGRGQDPDGKADYQGCSEFNPQLVFSTDEDKQLSKNKDKRNAENAPNRRVMVFLFRPGTKIDPEKWPCPRASEGISGCKGRFWSDGEKRRNPQGERREFKDKKDTFACRFYHRLSDRSPCEGVLPTLRLRLYDEKGDFIANAPYSITVNGETRKGNANASGDLVERFQDLPDVATIEWGKDPTKPPEFKTNVFLGIDADDDSDALAQQRLHNLGYTLGGSPSDNVMGFQHDFEKEFGLELNGLLDDKTRDALRVVHAKCADNLKKTTKA